MSEFLKAGDHRFKPNTAQKVVATSAVLLLGAIGCGISTKDQNPIQTPQPIPTPSGLVSKACEPFSVPNWAAHGAIEFACPNKSEKPELRLNVTIRKKEDEGATTVSIYTSKFSVKGNEAKLEKEIKIGESRTVKPHSSTETHTFQNPVNPSCNITVVETSEVDNKPPTVAQACPR